MTEKNHDNIIKKGKTTFRNLGDSNYDQNNPFDAEVTLNQRVTSEDHFQNTRLVEFDIRKSGFRFSPGDVCYVQPKNLEENVNLFFEVIYFNYLNFLCYIISTHKKFLQFLTFKI